MKLDLAFKVSVITGLLFFSTHAFSDQMNTNSNGSTVMSSQKALTPAEDAAITRTLKRLNHQSKTLSKLNVNVHTKNGVVTMEGMVDSDTQVASLVENAESIVGVSDVDVSKLTVKDGKQPLADTLITAKIKGLLIREKLFGEKDIAALNTSVETKDGVVYLSGLVDNKTQIDNAIEIIKKSVPEVKTVEYNVKKIDAHTTY